MIVHMVGGDDVIRWAMMVMMMGGEGSYDWEKRGKRMCKFPCAYAVK